MLKNVAYTEKKDTYDLNPDRLRLSNTQIEVVISTSPKTPLARAV